MKCKKAVRRQLVQFLSTRVEVLTKNNTNKRSCQNIRYCFIPLINPFVPDAHYSAPRDKLISLLIKLLEFDRQQENC